MKLCQVIIGSIIGHTQSSIHRKSYLMIIGPEIRSEEVGWNISQNHSSSGLVGSQIGLLLAQNHIKSLPNMKLAHITVCSYWVLYTLTRPKLYGNVFGIDNVMPLYINRGQTHTQTQRQYNGFATASRLNCYKSNNFGHNNNKTFVKRY